MIGCSGSGARASSPRPGALRMHHSFGGQDGVRMAVQAGRLRTVGE